MKKIIFVLLVQFPMLRLWAQTDCNELVYYRDVTLIQQYDQAYKKYTLNQQNLADLDKMRDDLLNRDDHWWEMSTKTATTDGALALAVIMQNIKTQCTLISNILKIDPETGAIMNGLEKTAITATRIYKAITLGKELKSVITEGAEQTAYKKIISKAGPIGQAVKTAWEFAEDIVKMAKMPGEQDKLKSEVKRILGMIESETRKYAAEVNTSSDKIKDINEAKAGIDKYLLEFCKDAKPKALAVDKKTSLEPPVVPTRQIASAPPGKDAISFYIFFSISLYLDNKFYHIMSAPVFHLGKLSDGMEEEKETFWTQVKNQLPHRLIDDYLEKQQGALPEIQTRYGEPWSTALIVTKEDCNHAIGAWIDMQKKSMAGLPGEDTMLFIRLD
jgi:hypothetical protein